MSVVVVNPVSSPVPVDTTDTQEQPVNVSMAPDMSLAGTGTTSYALSSVISTAGTGAFAGPFLVNSAMVPPAGRYLVSGTVITQNTPTYYGVFVLTFRMSAGSGALTLTSPASQVYATSLGTQADNGNVSQYPIMSTLVTYAVPPVVINTAGTGLFQVVYAVSTALGSTGLILFRLTATPL
jgi:hypothetical protein